MDRIIAALEAGGIYLTNMKNLMGFGPSAQRTDDGTPCVYIRTADGKTHLIMMEKTGERRGHYRVLDGSFLPTGTTFEIGVSEYLAGYFIIVDKQAEPTE
jgi:hypothetical protein